MTMWYIIDQILIAVGLVIFLLVLLAGLDFYKLIRVSHIGDRAHVYIQNNQRYSFMAIGESLFIRSLTRTPTKSRNC